MFYFQIGEEIKIFFSLKNITFPLKTSIVVQFISLFYGIKNVQKFRMKFQHILFSLSVIILFEQMYSERCSVNSYRLSPLTKFNIPSQNMNPDSLPFLSYFNREQIQKNSKTEKKVKQVKKKKQVWQKNSKSLNQIKNSLNKFIVSTNSKIRENGYIIKQKSVKEKNKQTQISQKQKPQQYSLSKPIQRFQNMGRKTCPNIIECSKLVKTEIQKLHLPPKIAKNKRGATDRNSHQDKKSKEYINLYSEEEYVKSMNLQQGKIIKLEIQNPFKQVKLKEKEKKNQNFNEKSQNNDIFMSMETSCTNQNSMTSDDQFNLKSVSKTDSVNPINLKDLSLNHFEADLKINMFKIKKVLGRGKFGDVFEAIHKPTGFLVALKKIKKENIRKLNMQKQLCEEIKIHMSLDHPNIVKMYGFFEEKDDIFLILENIVGGTLFDYLNKKQKLSISETRNFLKGIISGIQYLHQKSVAHRDIKPQNILMSPGQIPKICDFGWAAIINETRKTYCGTFDYVPPEILQGKNYDMSVDIWCIGILTYELLLGKMPYEGDKRTIIIKKITNAEVKFPKQIPQEAKEFILWLVKNNPEERPKCNQLALHNFIKYEK